MSSTSTRKTPPLTNGRSKSALSAKEQKKLDDFVKLARSGSKKRHQEAARLMEKASGRC